MTLLPGLIGKGHPGRGSSSPAESQLLALLERGQSFFGVGARGCFPSGRLVPGQKRQIHTPERNQTARVRQTEFGFELVQRRNKETSLLLCLEKTLPPPDALPATVGAPFTEENGLTTRRGLALPCRKMPN